MGSKVVISFLLCPLFFRIIFGAQLLGSSSEDSRFRISQLPKTLAKGKTYPLVAENGKDTETKFFYPTPKPSFVVPLTNLRETVEPGKGTVYLPRVYIYPENLNFAVFGNDTIFNPVAIKPQIPAVKTIKPQKRDYSLFDIRFLDVEQGFPSSYVLCAFKDQSGALWLGLNDEGVVRYNGSIMQHFSPKSGFPLKSVRSVIQTRKGDYWFGSFEEGAVFYNGNLFYRYTKNQGLPDNTIYDIYEDSEGAIWLATGNGLCCIKENSVIVYGQNEGLRNSSLRSIASDANGNLWLGTWGGKFCSFNGNSFTYFSLQKLPISDNVLKINFDKKNNTLWLVFHTEHYARIKNDTLYVYKLPVGERVRFKDIAIDENGYPYLATSNNGIFYVKDSVITHFSPDNGLSHRDISVVFKIDGGSIAAGTRGGGLNLLNLYSFRHYTEELGFKNSLVFAITEDKSGNLWFGTETDGLIRYKKHKVEYYTNKGGLTSDIILTLTSVNNNNELWLGGWKAGVMKVSNGIITRFLSDDGLTDLNVVSTFLDEKQNLWIGTWGGGAFLYDGKYISPINETIGVDNPNVFDFQTDVLGNVWIATENGGLFCIYTIDRDTRLVYTYLHTHGLETEFFNCIAKDRYNNLWFGAHHNGGLYVLTEEEQRKNPENLKFVRVNLNRNDINQSIQSIVFDKFDRLWAGTDRGLLCLPKLYQNQQLNLSEDIPIIVFGTENGLRGLDFFRKALYIDQEGTLWMGTGKCLSAIDVEHLGASHSIPLPEINMVYIKGNYVDFSSLHSMSLPEGSDLAKIKFNGVQPFTNLPKELVVPFVMNHLTFFFSATEINYQANVQYQVRLDGFEDEWINIAENKIDFRNLPAGHYTFQVRAKGISGDWSIPAQFSFRVLPPFWATWYAILFYALVFVGAVLGFNQFRSKQLIKKQKELQYLVNHKTHELSQKNEELNQLLHEVSLQRDEIEQQRDMVFQQKEELEKIHHELTQSIDYAVRIQRSLISGREDLTIRFPENFILYMPKDKVSGDFYFSAFIDNIDIIAVADCTGHGVPGAFMSLLGITLVREIVKKDGITDTAMILTLLRQEIITVLRQELTPESQKDGMDISIVAIDKNAKTIQYSGAHQSIYHVHRANLVEYKGDWTTVSVHPKMIPFNSKIFPYQPGDILYLFTDGFADQFAQNGHQKIKSTGFKEMLMKSLYLPMDKQGAQLRKYFEQWKGDYPQIDDVTVLGVKL